MLNVDVARGNDLQKAVEHTRLVAVDEAQAALSQPVQRRVREIDAVADVAVAEIIHNLPRGHNRALFLRLRRCGAEVREADNVFPPDELRVREVGHIARDLPALNGGKERVVVHKLAAGKVQYAHAGLHLRKCFGVQVVERLRRGVNVHGEIVARAEKGMEIRDVLNLAREVPRGIDGEIRIVPAHLHIELERGVCHAGADRAKTNDAEALAGHLRPGESVLSLLHKRGDLIALRGEGFHPLDRADNVARGHGERAQQQLLDRVGVRAGGVEHRDALGGAALDGDVVHADAGAADAEELFIEYGVVQLRRADEKRVGRRLVGADGAAFRFQLVNALLGNGVHGFYIKHGVSPQIPS